ncbi:MAG: glycosyltransferase [Pedosphaera sp.]|nr:glycosyltransferase [Pedosphaera sp.]
MKILLFAHIPPPHHGQSFMVQQLLAALGGDARQRTDSAVVAEFDCYHVNARFSDDVADIGRPRPGKLWWLLKYCGEALRMRWHTGVGCLFYVPAPPQNAALVRDWLVMALLRPFFPRRVFWWQAAGMGEWLADAAPPWKRWLTRRLVGRPSLSIVLSEWGRRDAEALSSERIVVVANCIPDPCPNFATQLLPLRQARAAIRRRLLAGVRPSAVELVGGGEKPDRYQLLFLSLCTREKGLFDAVDAVALLNQRLAQAGCSLRVALTVAGDFRNQAERKEFLQRLGGPGLVDAMGEPLVRLLGFVTGENKTNLMRESDGLCFPTFYAAESFGIVLIEAMAWGLGIVTTRWRTIPDLFPTGFDGLVPVQSPEAIANTLEAQLGRDCVGRLRDWFLSRYTADHCLPVVKRALLDLERAEELAGNPRGQS